MPLIIPQHQYLRPSVATIFATCGPLAHAGMAAIDGPFDHTWLML